MVRSTIYRINARQFVDLQNQVESDQPAPGDTYTKAEVDALLATNATNSTIYTNNAIAPLTSQVNVLSSGFAIFANQTNNAITDLQAQMSDLNIAINPIIDGFPDLVTSVTNVEGSINALTVTVNQNVTTFSNQISNIFATLGHIQDEIDSLNPGQKPIARHFRGFRVTVPSGVGAHHFVYEGLDILVALSMRVREEPTDGDAILSSPNDEYLTSLGQNSTVIMPEGLYGPGKTYFTEVGAGPSSISNLETIMQDYETLTTKSIRMRHGLVVSKPRPGDPLYTSIEISEASPFKSPKKSWTVVDAGSTWRVKITWLQTYEGEPSIAEPVLFCTTTSSGDHYDVVQVGLVSSSGTIRSSDEMIAIIEFFLMGKASPILPDSNRYSPMSMNFTSRMMCLTHHLFYDFYQVTEVFGHNSLHIHPLTKEEPMLTKARAVPGLVAGSDTCVMTILWRSGRLLTNSEITAIADTIYSTSLKDQLSGFADPDTPLTWNGVPSNFRSAMFGGYVCGINMILPSSWIDGETTLTVMPTLHTYDGEHIGIRYVPKSIREYSYNTEPMDISMVLNLHHTLTSFSGLTSRFAVIDGRIQALIDAIDAAYHDLETLSTAFEKLATFVQLLVPAPKPVGLSVVDTLLNAGTAVLGIVYPPAMFLTSIVKDVIDDIATKQLSGVGFEEIALNILGAIIVSGIGYSTQFSGLINDIRRRFTFSEGGVNVSDEVEMQNLKTTIYSVENAAFSSIEDDMDTFNVNQTEVSAAEIVNYADLPFPKERVDVGSGSKFFIEDAMALSETEPSGNWTLVPMEGVTYTCANGETILFDGTNTTVTTAVKVYVSAWDCIVTKIVKGDNSLYYVRTREADVRISEIISTSGMPRSIPLYTESINVNASFPPSSTTSLGIYSDTTTSTSNRRGNIIFSGLTITLEGRTDANLPGVPIFLNVPSSGQVNLVLNFSTDTLLSKLTCDYTLHLDNVFITTGTWIVSSTIFAQHSLVRDSNPAAVSFGNSTKLYHSSPMHGMPIYRAIFSDTSSSFESTYRINQSGYTIYSVPISRRSRTIFKFSSLVPYTIAEKTISEVALKYGLYQLNAPFIINEGDHVYARIKERFPISMFSMARVMAA